MAGTASAIMAGAAFVKITADNAELKQRLDEAQSKIRSFASAINSFSSKMALLGPLAAVPLVAATRAFAAFDDQMRLTGAVTGATGTQFENLSEQAKKLGRETSFTAAQVASGMASLGRMGFNPEQIQASIKPMMNLARATGTDLATAAQIAANNLSVFKMSAEQSSDVADILTVTANSSAQTLTDLGEALKTAAPHAARAGANLQDTAAMLGVLANMGIRGSLAGTALGKSFKRLADPAIVDFLHTCGVEVKDLATGEMRNMKDILVDIAKYMKTLNGMDKINFAEAVFDARGSLGGGTLSVNTDQIDAMMKKLSDCRGAAQATADQMDSGLGGAMRRLASAAEGINIALGEIIATSFGPVIESASSFLLAIRNLIGANKDLVAGALGAAGSFIGFGFAIKTISILAGTIKSVFSPLSALNKLVTGSAEKTAEAVAAEQQRAAATEARVSREIAAEKLKTANELAEIAKQKTALADKAAAELQALKAKKTANDLAIAESAETIAAKQAETAAIIAEEQKIIAAQQGRRGRAAAQTIQTAQAKIQAAQSEASATIAAEQAKQAAIEKTNIALTAQIAQQNGVATAAAKSASVATAASAKAANDYTACAKAATAATAAETKLATAKDIANAKDLARGRVLANVVTMQKFRIAYTQREAAVIMATSMKSMVAAKTAAGGSALKAAGYYAEAAAAKVAAGATMALNAALGFIAANPVTAALIALYGAFKLVESFDNQAAEAAEKNVRVQQRLAAEYKAERESLEKQIKTDQSRIQKLIDLEKQGKLTATQQLEAQKIIEELAARYGNLGIEIDKVTGKLTGASAAFKKMNDQQREQIINSLHKEAEQNQKSADALRNSFKQQFGILDRITFPFAGKKFDLLNQMGFYKTDLWKWDLTDYDGGATIERMKKALLFAQDNGMDQQANKIKEIIRYLEDRKKIEERIAELRKGGAVTPESKGPTAEEEARRASAKELADAEKELARIDEENARKKMTHLEQELHQIEKIKTKYLELADLKKADLQAELQAAQKRMKANEAQANPVQIAAYEDAKKAAEEAQAKIDALEKRIAAAKTSFDEQAQTAKQKDADRKAKSEKKYTGFLEDTQQKQQTREADRAQNQKFDELKKDKTPEGKKALEEFMKQLTGNLETAKQKYKEMLDTFKKSGSEGGDDLSENERIQLDAIQKEISARIDRLNSYRDRIGGGIQTAQQEQQKQRTMASFNAAVLENLFDKSGRATETREERIAKATEETAKNTKKLTQTNSLMVG